MRTNAVVFTVALLVSQPVLAQEWGLYVSTPDGFQINFPGTPKVTETTWRSQMDYVLPERVYSVDRSAERMPSQAEQRIARPPRGSAVHLDAPIRARRGRRHSP